MFMTLFTPHCPCTEDGPESSSNFGKILVFEALQFWTGRMCDGRMGGYRLAFRSEGGVTGSYDSF